MLMEICRSSYTSASYLTIDEQLLGFRGRCPFRTYIPNKPSNDGIKIVMLCDSSSKYMIDANPYLGKSTNTGGLPLANFYVKELTKSIHGSNRNITMDNWFTSVPLADELLEQPYKLTIIGTLRKNKKEIPPELLNTDNRPRGTSMFCFDKNKTLVSYLPKPNKIVMLLSTMHEGATISENGKPDIIINYNETKAGVDTFDQLCSNMNCSRKTRRRPLCVFYGIINIATINSFVIYCDNSYKANNKPVSRFQYMFELGKILAEPWMRQRLDISNLRRNIRENIHEILDIKPVPESVDPIEKKRTVCFFCPSRLRKMPKKFCVQCKRAICRTHNRNCCPECPFS
ncbi:piggyBac transposable element-derived protein 4-like [Euwallacea fornicatus]|uniref:piggyBac transposable element-derived protein 4-like n=1 Tax=Euwallacea fornicatus TaxID=995702 RepID=UPI00338E6EC9